MRLAMTFTTPVLLTALFAGAALSGAFVWVLRVFFRTSGRHPVDLAWLDRFSTTRYRAMERLLDEDDYRFLDREAPGTGLSKQLRARRLELFRGYLRTAERDFSRICSVLKAVAVHSPVDRPELAQFVLRQHITFTLLVLRLEARLIAHRFGGARVDVSALVQALEGMRLQAAPVFAPAAG